MCLGSDEVEGALERQRRRRSEAPRIAGRSIAGSDPIGRQDVCVAATVRRAQLGDAAAVAELHLQSALEAFAGIFPPEAPAPEVADLIVDWAQGLGDDRPANQVGFAAEEGGSLVGVVVAGPDPDDPECGHISRLYVAPSQWQRGIGRLLYERAIGHLRDVGYGEATLWVLEGNARARCWYEALGWRATAARKPTYAPAGIDDIGYRLVLHQVDP
jgi:GNAT superfamily N-acetyltransferase